MAERQAREPELTPREAISQYEKAVKEHGDARAHFDLGSAYYVAHDLDNAFREFQQAVSMSPAMAHAHYYLGVIYAARGDAVHAREELQRVSQGDANIMLKTQAVIRLRALDGR